MKRLKITHYLQDPHYCAVAACSVIVNYHDQNIDYEITKNIAEKKISKKILEEGLESVQMCMLLNELGFYKVTFITSHLSLVDYEWLNFGRKKMIKALEISAVTKTEQIEKANTRLTIKWLKRTEYNNNLIISYDFGKYIRQHLNRKKPVILTFNWTMFQKFAKEGENGADPYNGEEEEHAVVVNGYDDKGVWIVDSHHQHYKYKRKKYRKGFYKISWENLLTCMGQGDIILPDDYHITG